MEKYNKRDAQGRLIDWILPERDDDRLYYRVVINRKLVHYASNEEDAFVVLTDLLEARDDGHLEEAIDKLYNE